MDRVLRSALILWLISVIEYAVKATSENQNKPCRPGFFRSENVFGSCVECPRLAVFCKSEIQEEDVSRCRKACGKLKVLLNLTSPTPLTVPSTVPQRPQTFPKLSLSPTPTNEVQSQEHSLPEATLESNDGQSKLDQTLKNDKKTAVDLTVVVAIVCSLAALLVLIIIIVLMIRLSHNPSSDSQYVAVTRPRNTDDESPDVTEVPTSSPVDDDTTSQNSFSSRISIAQYEECEETTL